MRKLDVTIGHGLGQMRKRRADTDALRQRHSFSKIISLKLNWEK